MTIELSNSEECFYFFIDEWDSVVTMKKYITGKWFTFVNVIEEAEKLVIK